MRADYACSKAMTQVSCLPAVSGPLGPDLPWQSWEESPIEKKGKKAKLTSFQVLLTHREGMIWGGVWPGEE